MFLIQNEILETSTISSAIADITRMPFERGITLISLETPPTIPGYTFFHVPSRFQDLTMVYYQTSETVGAQIPPVALPTIQFEAEAPEEEDPFGEEAHEDRNDDEDVTDDQEAVLVAEMVENIRQEGTVMSGALEITSPADCWDGRGQGKFLEKVSQVFSPLGYRNIKVIVPNGIVYDKADADNELLILVWSCAAQDHDRSKMIKPPEKLFGEDGGFKVDCRDNAFPASGQGKVIMIDGFPAMEFIAPNRLFFTWDAVHTDTEHSLNIWEKCLRRFVEEIGEKELIKQREGIAQFRTELAQKNLKTLITKSFRHELDSAQDQITKLTSKIDELTSNLVLSLRDRARKMELLNGIDAKEIDSKAEKLLRDLMKAKGVKSVDFKDDMVLIYTDDLHVTDPRTRRVHLLGKFEIRAFVDHTKNPLLFNMDRQVEAYGSKKMQAPHVFPDGKPCLGDLVQSLPEVQARHDYATMAALCIMFLQSVNTDDSAGRWVHRWPRLEADGTYSEWGTRPKEERTVCGVS